MILELVHDIRVGASLIVGKKSGAETQALKDQYFIHFLSPDSQRRSPK